MTRWPLSLLGLSLLALTISGHTLSELASTPETIVSQGFSCSEVETIPAKKFQILTTHSWSQGVIVLYSALCPAPNSSTDNHVIGQEFVIRQGLSWKPYSGSSYWQERSTPPTHQLVEYDITRTIGKQGSRYTILYGQILSPQVKAIEATFNNGQILRSPNQQNAFVLLAPGASHVCELRILGYGNQLLRRDELSLEKPGNLAHISRSACLPTTLL